MLCTWFLYIPLAQLCVFSRNVHNEYFVYDRARTAIWSHLRPFAVNGGQSLTDSTEKRENSQAAPPADAPFDAHTDAPADALADAADAPPVNAPADTLAMPPPYNGFDISLLSRFFRLSRPSPYHLPALEHRL